jgi:Ca2+/Na+ antiporter
MELLFIFYHFYSNHFLVFVVIGLCYLSKRASAQHFYHFKSEGYMVIVNKFIVALFVVVAIVIFLLNDGFDFISAKT